MDVESIDFVGSQDGDGARCEQAEGDNSNIEDVKAMIDASCHGRMHVIQTLVSKNGLYVSMQDQVTGQSPLMAAASAGNHALCQYLLDAGAPWNALDRQGRCAGDYATAAEQWSVVNLLVEWGVRAELILGQLDRTHREKTSSGISSAAAAAAPSDGLVPVDQQPSTKPDYLRQRLQYSEDGQSLLDQDQDAVMMEWERPLMKAHAQIMMEEGRRSVMNVGFGMGIIDSALQEYQPDLHIIIEAHQDVYRRMLEDGWDRKPNVRLCFGRWQDVVPRLREEKITVDSIFFDTYGEHYLDLEDFHQQMVHLLAQPGGVYSFFNGLAPDNLFFHGVACQCVQLQLSSLGLDCEFFPCEIQVKDEVWEGIRRRYWHGRDTYYLPRATWNVSFLSTGRTIRPVTDSSPAKVKKADGDLQADANGMVTDSPTAYAHDDKRVRNAYRSC